MFRLFRSIPETEYEEDGVVNDHTDVEKVEISLDKGII